jgi:hypothetical protein
VTGQEFGGVDIDLLADYVGGALEGTPDEAMVAARIADDPRWRAAYESLAPGMSFVSAELGRLDTEPMPADLAARLESAFTAATSAAAPSTTATSAAASSTAASFAGDSDVTAAAGDAPDASAPAGRAAARHLAPVRNDRSPGNRENPVPKKAHANAQRRRRWIAPTAVAAGLIAFVGFGLDYLSGRSSQQSTDSSAGSASSLSAPSRPSSENITASGTNYSLQTLASGAVAGPAQPLNGLSSSAAPSHKATPGMAAEGSTALHRLIGSDALGACLEAIERANAGGHLSVESVDYAQFRGSPALVVRFTAANGHWAWASGPACGTTAGGAAKLAAVPVG